MTGRFAIVGAGAIGSIVGCHLSRAGHEVAFVETNEAHVAAMRDRGLHMSGALDMMLKADVQTPATVRGPLGTVLLAVKARHTVAALQPLVPLLAPDAVVVSLQNGLEEHRIAALIGKARTIGAYLTFGGHYRAPGEVVYGGPGSFRIGELDGRITRRLQSLQDALSAVQPVETTSNIFGYLWAKMALGAIYFATALVSADVLEIYAHPAYRKMLGALAGEVVQVGEAEGTRMESCDGFDPKVFRPGASADPVAVEVSWDGQRRYWGRHQGGRTGVWRDLAQRHRPTEVNEQVTAVVDRARLHGIEVPRLEALIALIHQAEAGRPLAWGNLDELVSLHERLCDRDVKAQMRPLFKPE